MVKLQREALKRRAGLLLSCCVAITTLFTPIFNSHALDPDRSIADQDALQQIQHEL